MREVKSSLLIQHLSNLVSYSSKKLFYRDCICTMLNWRLFLSGNCQSFRNCAQNKDHQGYLPPHAEHGKKIWVCAQRAHSTVTTRTPKTADVKPNLLCFYKIDRAFHRVTHLWLLLSYECCANYGHWKGDPSHMKDGIESRGENACNEIGLHFVFSSFLAGDFAYFLMICLGTLKFCVTLTQLKEQVGSPKKEQTLRGGGLTLWIFLIFKSYYCLG